MFVTGYQGFFNPSQEVQIAAGQTDSAALNTGGMCLTGIILPSLFTGTGLTFLVGDSADGFQANGEALFSGSTTNNDTLTINSVVTTFKDTVSNPLTQVQIGADEDETVANLLEFLQASLTAGLLACNYAANGALLTVTAVAPGTAGNAFTFAKSSTEITLTPSGGTLTGGGFRPLYTSANALVSMTVAQGRCYAVDPANFNGVAFLKIKSGSTEGSARNIVCSLKGL